MSSRTLHAPLASVPTMNVRSHRPLGAVALTIATLLTGCSDAAGERDPTRYPMRYQRALEAAATAPVPADGAKRFVDFFTTIDQPGLSARVEALYGRSLYFSDTLFVTQDRGELARHF